MNKPIAVRGLAVCALMMAALCAPAAAQPAPPAGAPVLKASEIKAITDKPICEKMVFGMVAFSDLITPYENAANADPGNAIVLNNLGYVYFSNQRYGEAIRELDKALKKDPVLYEAWYNKSQCAYDQGNNAEARACADKAISLKPDRTEAYLILGYVQQDTKDLKGAKATFEKLLALNPKHPQAKEMIKQVNAALGIKVEAVDTTDKATILANRIATAQKPAIEAFKAERWEEAIAQYLKVVEIGKEDEKGQAALLLDAYTALGAAYRKLEKNREAKAMYNAALKVNDRSILSLRALADIYQAENVPIQLVVYFKKILTIEPKDMQVRAKLAMTQMKLNMTDDAIEQFKAILEIQPTEAFALYNLGVIYRDIKKDPAISQTYFQQVLEFALATEYAPRAAMNLASLLDAQFAAAKKADQIGLRKKELAALDKVLASPRHAKVPADIYAELEKTRGQLSEWLKVNK